MKYYSSLFAASLLTMSSTAMSAVITHTFDRDTVFSNIEMKRVLSTGETLADGAPIGPPPWESAAGDILVEITWVDDTKLEEIWRFPSGKGDDVGAVLFAGIDAPGVNIELFDFTGPLDVEYRAFVEQSGDTFSNPWEIRNFGNLAISQVVFSARGTPDMGFDTDDGDNPNHGDAGFLLYLDATLSQWNGTLNVHYDWFNNWNGTTDMFHRMTLAFDQNTLLQPNQSIVFYQDTDELYVPEPTSLALLGIGLAGLGFLRRRRT